ncbi:hypothetical protein BDN67DRAFT_369708 [Paxillus ammoniavirescens]|nr:hypothetical protein BDN67DRAFT_369708 [Paxillus ammoniavirescens]
MLYFGSILQTLANLHTSSYGGTMSRSVRRLLSLMRFFEAEKRTSIFLFLARWSPSPDATMTNVLDVVQNSDPIQFLRTFLHSLLGDDLAKRKARREARGCADIQSAHINYFIGTDIRLTTALGWVKSTPPPCSPSVSSDGFVSSLSSCRYSQFSHSQAVPLSSPSRLLSGIGLQLGDEIGTESIAWLRMPENVVCSADNSWAKLERATADPNFLLLQARSMATPDVPTQTRISASLTKVINAWLSLILSSSSSTRARGHFS